MRKDLAKRRSTHPAGIFALAFTLGATAIPAAAASCRARSSISAERTANRWSAMTPVLVVMLSATYRRFSFDEGTGRKIAARGEIACVTHMSRAGSKKVRVERKNHVRLIEVVYGVNGLAECKSRAFASAISAAGLVLVPFRFGKLRKQCAESARQASER